VDLVEDQVKAMALGAGVVMEPVQLLLGIAMFTVEETAAALVLVRVRAPEWALATVWAMAEVRKEPDTVPVRVMVVAMDTALAARKEREGATAPVPAAMDMVAAEGAGTVPVLVRAMGTDLEEGMALAGMGKVREEVAGAVLAQDVVEVLEAVRGRDLARVVDMGLVLALVTGQVPEVGLDMELDLVMETVILVAVANYKYAYRALSLSSYRSNSYEERLDFRCSFIKILCLIERHDSK